MTDGPTASAPPDSTAAAACDGGAARGSTGADQASAGPPAAGTWTTARSGLDLGSWRRSGDDRKVAGVCGGVARALAIDPLIPRVVLAVTAVLGVLAVAVLAVAQRPAGATAWAAPGSPAPTTDAAPPASPPPPMWGPYAAQQPAQPYAPPGAQTSPPYAGYAGHGGYVKHGGHGGYTWQAWHAGPQSRPPGGSFAHTWAAGTADPARAGSGASALVAPGKRRRSPLALLTVGVALLVAGALAARASWGGEDLDVPVIAASVLGVLGAGLVVGTWFGRARSLVALVLAAAVALVVTTTASVPLRGGFGDRYWQPTAAADTGRPFELVGGSATLDLQALDLSSGGDITVRASVVAGELVVLVPTGTTVRIDAEVGLGVLQLPMAPSESGVELKRATDLGSGEPGGGATLVVFADVGIGAVEVVHVPA